MMVLPFPFSIWLDPKQDSDLKIICKVEYGSEKKLFWIRTTTFPHVGTLHIYVSDSKLSSKCSSYCFSYLIVLFVGSIVGPRLHRLSLPALPNNSSYSLIEVWVLGCQGCGSGLVLTRPRSNNDIPLLLPATLQGPFLQPR